MPSYDPTLEPPRTLRHLLAFVSFHSIFLAMGAFVTAFALWFFLWPQWRMNHVFVETEGQIIGKRVLLWESSLTPQVQVRYRAGDIERDNWCLGTGTATFRLLPDGKTTAEFDAIAVGDRRPVWYDPAAPDRVVLERGYHVHWLIYPLLGVGLPLLLWSAGKIIRGVRAWSSRERGDEPLPSPVTGPPA